MRLFYGIDVDVRTAALLRKETTAFQRQQGVVMRQAVNLMRRAERRALASGTPLKSGTGDPKRGYGRLADNVSTSVKRTQSDVIGRVGFSSKGFYGRFHETGLDVITKGRSTGGRYTKTGIDRRGRRYNRTANVRGEPYEFRLKQRETLGPVAEANEEAAIEILGNAYGVFGPS